MQFSQNICFLIGNVTKDPELRFTPGGAAVARFGVATNRSIKKNEAWEKVTTFHNIVCWQKLAEYVSERLKKGMYVTVQGRIENRSYDAKDGTKRYVSEVIADSVFFSTPKNEAAANIQEYEEPPAQSEGPSEDVPF